MVLERYNVVNLWKVVYVRYGLDKGKRRCLHIDDV